MQPCWSAGRVGIEKTQIERARRPESHRTRQGELTGIRWVLEKDGQAIDEQRLRNAIHHRAEHGIEAHFLGKRAAEFDQRAAIVEPVAVEEMIEARLHPVAKRLKQECSDDDGDDGPGRPRSESGVRQRADQAIARK